MVALFGMIGIAIQVVGRWLPRSRWTDFEKLCINFLYR